MRRANSCSRSSKRKRNETLMEVPSIGMRLCVGDRAVPTEKKQAFDNEGEIVDLDVVL